MSGLSPPFYSSIHSHFGHQLEAHLLQRRILGHDRLRHRIRDVVVKLEIDGGRWGSHKVPSVTGQDHNLLLDLLLLRLAHPRRYARGIALLALDERVLVLVELAENSLLEERE